MIIAMARFCTQCGNGVSDSTNFCTSCGFQFEKLAGPKEPIAPITQTPPPSDADAISQVVAGEPSEAASKGGVQKLKRLTSNRWARLGAACVVVIIAVAGSFSVGKSSVDQEQIRKTGYDEGFETGKTEGYNTGYSAGENAGKSNGYDSGYDAGYDSGVSAGRSTGYSEGYTAGCKDVFDFSDGTFSYVVPYNPYGYGSGRYPGDYYTSASEC